MLYMNILSQNMISEVQRCCILMDIDLFDTIWTWYAQLFPRTIPAFMVLFLHHSNFMFPCLVKSRSMY